MLAIPILFMIVQPHESNQEPPLETPAAFKLNEREPAVVLLFKLQEIQAQLEHRTEADAVAISVALFELSLKMREKFDSDLYLTYKDLSPAHQKAYRKVAELVHDLDHQLSSSKPISLSPQGIAL